MSCLGSRVMRPGGNLTTQGIGLQKVRLHFTSLRAKRFGFLPPPTQFSTSGATQGEAFANSWARVHALTSSAARIPQYHVATHPSSQPTGRLAGTPTSRRDVKPGQLVWGAMIIDPFALRQPPGPKTEAMRRIFAGKAVYKLAYVLEVQEKYVFAAYATTLGSATQIEQVVTEPKHWYPVSPAPSNGRFDPLPSVDGKPAWIYLGMPVVLAYEPIHILESFIPSESVKLVRGAMAHQQFVVG